MYIDPNNIPASEGTLYVSQDQNYEQPVQETVQEEYAEVPAAPLEARSQKGSGTWKGVLIGGIPGIALGVGGAFLGTSLLAKEHDDDDREPGEAEIYDTAPVAESVTDDMSFAEAFEAAREEVGAGGVFVWHGQAYSTYTQDEWESLTPEQQGEYVESLVNAGVIGGGASEETEVEPDVDNTDEPNGLEGEESDLDNEGGTQGGTTDGEPADEPGYETDGPVGGPTDAEGTHGIDVLGSEVEVQEVGYYQNEDGSEGVAAIGTVDGHSAAFLDVDADGVVDQVLVDTDDDGHIAPEENFDLSDSGLTVGDLANQVDNGATDPSDELYAGGSDYTNDADTTSLC